MEELTNYDIEDISKYFKIKLKAVIDYHDILKYPLLDGSYILNLGDTHWCALFVKNKCGMYFDSFGQIYPTEVKQFCPNITYSTDIIQSLNSILCGYFCLYFCYYFTNKFKKDFRNTINLFCSQFSENKSKNNKILQTLIKKLL